MLEGLAVATYRKLIAKSLASLPIANEEGAARTRSKLSPFCSRRGIACATCTRHPKWLKNALYSGQQRRRDVDEGQ